MKIRAVVFDWAGTLIDHGSRAPVAALRDVFASAGVPVTVAEVRLSMGIAKRDHIAAILALPRVAEAWKRARGVAPRDADVSSLYADFLPKQVACLGHHSGLIAGVPGAAEGLRTRGIRIGSTTGYTRTMLAFLVERAREQGFVPDCAICPEDVPGGGRPAPWMCWLNAIRLEVSPLWAMVKIGDTPSDIEEGLNAGMWTIGITRTGNEAGLTEEEWNSATVPEKAAVIEQARKRLLEAGAHYLVESVGESLDVIDEIAARLSFGERPASDRP
jgi:phosphonoacetaldehyde hydrolase